MVKINKDSARQKLRLPTKVSKVAEFANQDPNYTYKLVCATFSHDPDAIDKAIDRGWEVVYDKSKIQDDRKNSAKQDGSEEDLRLSPVTFTTRSGHTQVLMRIPKDQFQKNEMTDEKERTRRYEASSKRQVIKKGNQVRVIDPEVNLNNSDSGE